MNRYSVIKAVIKLLEDLKNMIPVPNCSICGEPWQDHYKHNAKWKNGPYGTFDLKSDHVPHIKGIHAERKVDRLA